MDLFHYNTLYMFSERKVIDAKLFILSLQKDWVNVTYLTNVRYTGESQR